MSQVLDTSLERTYGFYELTVGKKVVMAATGVVLFGYVIGHMLGNLQIFAGPEMINRYAHFLHSNPGPLWAVRVVLLAAVFLHILTSFQLWLLSRRARPIRYRRKNDLGADYAARTMYWSGPIIAAFVIFHVLHLTVGSVPGLPLSETATGLDVYTNVVTGFRHPLVSLAYIVAIVLLTMHLYHGIWSMFQTMGLSHPRYTPVLKRFAHLFSILIAVGYISIPVAVLTGLIGSEVR